MKNFRLELLSKWILYNIYNQSLNIIECWLDTKWKLDFFPRTFSLRGPPTVNFSSNETSAKLCPVFYFSPNFVDIFTGATSYKIWTLSVDNFHQQLWSFIQSLLCWYIFMAFFGIGVSSEKLSSRTCFDIICRHEKEKTYSHWRLISCRV